MDTAYLFGAGFSVAANGYLRPEDHGMCGGYPLGAELSEKCFDESYDFSLGVEEAFHIASVRSDHQPLEALIDILQVADNCPGQRAAADPSSAVRRFVAQRPTATYLTFNYDCLIEQALLQLNRWYPSNGFGIQAEAGLPPNIDAALLQRRSSSKVLHLHGSLYFYAREFDLSRRDASGTQLLTLKDMPEFVFDPNANAALFMPFEKGDQDLRYSLPPERILAPVPDKAAGLAKSYIRVIYEAAEAALRTCQVLVAIGYRFGETDRASYVRLLDAFRSQGEGRCLHVVAPDAKAIAKRIAREYPTLALTCFEGTFEKWVTAGYP